MSDLIRFDPEYPTVASPAPPDRYREFVRCEQPRWFTVIMLLHETHQEIQVLYVSAYDKTDAGVRAAAHILTIEEKRVVGWLEAHYHLSRYPHDVFTIEAQVSIYNSFVYPQDALLTQLAEDWENLCKKEGRDAD